MSSNKSRKGTVKEHYIQFVVKTFAVGTTSRI